MTLLDHGISQSRASVDDVSNDSDRHKPSRPMHNPAASQGSTGGVLRCAMATAVVITAIVAAASFVLSFAALWDLATMAGMPRHLSWLWPVIVDGTILQATISVVAVSVYQDQRSSRRFFWIVLAASALVSVSSNALHAFLSEAGALHPALAAVIATAAPASLLATTHSLSVLLRIGSAESAKSEQLAADEAGDDGPSPHRSQPPSWEVIAQTLHDRGLSERTPNEIEHMLKAKFEEQWSNRKIAEQLGIHHSTVGRVLTHAAALLPD